jgi:hypothetical protein
VSFLAEMLTESPDEPLPVKPLPYYVAVAASILGWLPDAPLLSTVKGPENA